MAILYVGDIHDRLQAIIAINNYCIKHNISTVVQVGDFGLLFKDFKSRDYFQKRKRQNRPGPVWYTCGGNHDNYARWQALATEQGDSHITELAPGAYWVKRGGELILDNKLHLFIGGAESTDIAWRTEGKNWWPEETPTSAEFQLFHQNLKDNHPQVVVSHDAPLRVDLFRAERENSTTPRMLEHSLKFSEYTPPLWVYGHHHLQQVDEIQGTKFVCCGLNGQWWSEIQGFGGKQYH
jgi:predicted phosphodiesterase